jgi:hypothetical protein
MIKVYYRLSNQSAGGHKSKLPHASKQYCLENAIKAFGKENITVIGDNLNKETVAMVLDLGTRLVRVSNGTGSKTFRDALDLAIEETSGTDVIYLLEDDFLHKENAGVLLEEAAQQFDAYITGYDHPDKYINRADGGNPLIESGGEVTRLVRTENSHWKITNSTVMSFATTRKRLVADRELLEKYSSERITDSFGFFLSLAKEKGVPCISSVPGISTHIENAWLSPFTDWNKV